MNEKMTIQSRDNSAAEHGMSLIEVLVAVSVFTVVLLATLMLYDRSQRAFVRTESDTTQQQNVRFVMDQVVGTLRDAGANVNPSGEAARVDEQIEAAFESAIVVRGDFDNSREGNLEGTAANEFPMVTTANDEIVGFILTKADPALNTQTLTIKADLTGTGGAPRRDAGVNAATTPPTVLREETRTVNAAALTVAQQTDPPYRLERITFDAAGNVVSQVIAENIFRLQFDYFPQDGLTPIVSTTLGSADTGRDIRRTVRRIAVNLIATGERPDLDLTDTATYPAVGTVASPASLPVTSTKRRKFALAEEVRAENLGKRGRPHANRPTPILAAPTFIQACVGNCNSVLLSWGGVTGISTYIVRVNAPAAGIHPAISNFTYQISGTNNRFDTTEVPPVGRAYTFAVAAKDASGNVSAYSPSVTVTPVEGAGNTPMAVSSVPTAAQAGTTNTIRVDWTPVDQNVTPLISSCYTSGVGGATSLPAPGNQALVDLQTYEVHREISTGMNGAFVTTASNRVDNKSFGTLSNSSPGVDPTFTDRLAAPCEDYFYRVVPRDRCGNGAASASPPMMTPVSFNSTDPPTTPTGLDTLSSGSTVGANHSITLRWNPVTTTAGGNQVAVARYEIVREQKTGVAGIYGAGVSIPVFIANAGDPHEYVDSVPTHSGVNPILYRYVIRARYTCGAQSAYSAEFIFPCPVTGSVSITSPTAGMDFDPPGTLNISVRANGATFHGVQGTVVDAGGNVFYTFSSNATVTAGNSYNFSWAVPMIADQVLIVSASGLQTTGVQTCSTPAAPVAFDIINASACFRFAAAPVFNPTNDTKHLEFQLVNNCATAQRITGFRMTWTDQPFSGNQIKKVQHGATDINDQTISSGTQFGFNKLAAPSQILVNAGAVSNTFRFEFDKELHKAPLVGRTSFPTIVVYTVAIPGGEPNLGPVAP